MSVAHGKLGGLPYFLAGLSFVPLIGMVFGVVTMVWGLTTKRAGGKVVALIGAGGTALTMAWYVAFGYLGATGEDTIDDNTAEVLRARHEITSLTYAIEFYKSQTGKYPLSLDTLLYSMPPDQGLVVLDPMIAKTAPSRFFHYELVDAEHYILLGMGVDGQRFTSDDILPDVAIKPESDVGLMMKRREHTVSRGSQ